MKNKKSTFSARMPLAITLIIAAFASAFFISTYSNKGANYWVIANSIPPGHRLSESDLVASHLNLGESSQNYLNTSDQIIGLVATRNLSVGEVISTTDVTDSSNAMSTSAVSLSLRSVDLAAGVVVGDSVDIYWVLDSRNGEAVIDPILILGGVSVVGLDDSKNALGGDIGITVAIEKTQVLRLLSATTQGRLVMVRAYV
jgi:Flp pilus assembly protein CpaB